MAGDLPGYGQTQAAAALVAASCVSILRLPLSSILLTTAHRPPGRASS